MEYFTIGDIANQGFYPIPEKLFNNKHYQKKVKKIKKVKEKGVMVPKEIITTEEILTDTSKLIYGVMCRYLNFSLQNGWFDEKKRVYIKLSLTTLGEILNKSRDTIVKSKKQLESVGLLKIVKTQYKSDTFYLGKVKDKPGGDILTEVENRIKEEKILEVDNIDQSKDLPQVVESIDSVVVESIDPIRVVPIRVEKRVVAGKEETPAATPEEDFTKTLKELLTKFGIRSNPSTIKNITSLAGRELSEVERAISYMELKGKSMAPNILVAILRDGDYKASENIVPKDMSRKEKIDFMKKELGEEELGRLRDLIVDAIGSNCSSAIEDSLGNTLCRKFNEYLENGGSYI